ncbi:MAG: dihydrolipoyl dehydrogenase family protein, partial [Microcoleus sp.]
MAKQKYDFDLIVIGSGAGGSIAAHIAAQAGKRVAMIEADTYGGETPNWGCVPTQALLHAANVYSQARNGQTFGIRGSAVGYNYPSVKAWKDTAVRRTGASKTKEYYEAEGITVIHGLGHFINPHEVTVNRRHLSSEYFLIASGSRVAVPNIEGIEQAGYLTMREAVDLVRPPKSLFIVGGGSVGCEFAQLFSIFGTKVYIADIEPRLLPNEDSEVSVVVEDVFTNDLGMQLLTSTKVTKVAKEGVMKRVTFQRGGVNTTIKVEDVLLATGKIANTDFGLENAGVSFSSHGIEVNDQMQTSAHHIYAAGDVVGPYLYTHMAIYQSRVATHNILHRDKQSVDYSAVPRLTFLTPEVASVGMREEECLRRDLPIKKAIAPLNIIARAN